ncbi:MAG: hypothetical protein WA939_20510 [Nodosilinea sp.]
MNREDRHSALIPQPCWNPSAAQRPVPKPSIERVHRLHQPPHPLAPTLIHKQAALGDRPII